MREEVTWFHFNSQIAKNLLRALDRHRTEIQRDYLITGAMKGRYFVARSATGDKNLAPGLSAFQKTNQCGRRSA